VRVVLEKVDGIEAVSVTVKRGVAHITLKKGNTVTLADLRRLIKDAGYSSRDAVVTVVGAVQGERPRLTLAVSGTTEVFDLSAGMERSLADVERHVGRTVEVSGTIPAPDPKDARGRMQVQSVSDVR
jgi:hypothetical protein